jgi:chemotaxis protein methyltransferase CheR
MSLDLSPQVFAILSALIEDRTGLHYSLLDRGLLASKAGLRAEEAGFDSLLDYYYFLRYDPGGERELIALTEALVVNETHFFRELSPLQTLVEGFVAPWVRAGRRPRIWSAACSTGEEPLSLAMLLDSQGLLDQVELVASDISSRALQVARDGRYGRRSVRQIPSPALYARYLRIEGDRYFVERRLIEAVRWCQINLTDDAAVRGLGTFDAIICRNVLIYFSDETVQVVVERLGQNLSRDGVLLVGVSESLLRFGSAFVGEELGGVFVYRKAG